MFFPETDKVLEPIHRGIRYFKGHLRARCNSEEKTFSFLAFDHGAYPWGRSPSRGALASLCRLLGITTESGTFNCCCFIHILVAILDFGLVTIKDLFTKNEPLLRTYLSSQELRDDDVVINDVLHSLNLEDAIFVQTISRGIDNEYYLSPQIFGNCEGKGVFLVFDASKKHFFLAKPLDVLSGVPLSVVFIDSK